MNTVLNAYLVALLWSETDDGNYSIDDIAPESINQAERDVSAMLAAAPYEVKEFWTPEQFGHDFALSRNGHGAGFFDRYLGVADRDECEVLGEQLQRIAMDMGPVYCYVGNDGRVYIARG